MPVGLDRGDLRARQCCLSILLIVVGVWLGSCGAATDAPPSAAVSTPPVARQTVTVALLSPMPIAPSPSATHPEVTIGLSTPEPMPPPPTATEPEATIGLSPTVPRVLSPTATQEPTRVLPSPTWTATPRPSAGRRLGMGLRRQTVPTVTKYKDQPGFVMCATVGLAESYFPQLEGWIRVLGAPSLETLRQKAEEARKRGVPYEALSYGLETNSSTPREEWQDLVGSTQKARAIADEYGKLLVMGPGFRLMSQNWDQYPAMAALSDMWVIQTQRLQVDPPGTAYREGVKRVVDQIRSGNANIAIWAQITLPPDREPSAEEWLAYRQAVIDLVDGTYIGVYHWESANSDRQVATIEEILAAVYKSEQ